MTQPHAYRTTGTKSLKQRSDNVSTADGMKWSEGCMMTIYAQVKTTAAFKTSSNGVLSTLREGITRTHPETPDEEREEDLKAKGPHREMLHHRQGGWIPSDPSSSVTQVCTHRWGEGRSLFTSTILLPRSGGIGKRKDLRNTPSRALHSDDSLPLCVCVRAAYQVMRNFGRGRGTGDTHGLQARDQN